jgi:hypothetical protein
MEFCIDFIPVKIDFAEIYAALWLIANFRVAPVSETETGAWVAAWLFTWVRCQLPT